MENGTRNKRRAHHAETNSGTDIVTSDKRMHTRLAVLFSCDSLSFLYSFIPTACFTVPGILHTVWYRIFGYTIYILLYMSETCRFSLERCIYILYMFFTEFNQFQNFSEFLSNCDFCATISTKIQILWNMYIPKVFPSIFIVNQF